MLGRVSDGYLAVDVEKILCVFRAVEITFIPTMKEHLLGVLVWNKAVLPVVDLAVSRPPCFEYKGMGGVVVTIKGRDDDMSLGIFFEQILCLKDAARTHFNWRDKFNLRRTFYLTECFSVKLDVTLDGVMIPVIEGEKIIEFFKHTSNGLKGGGKW